MIDPVRIKEHFPVLRRKVNGHPIAYLDNAATTQKPEVVIRALSAYYEHFNANIHRGVHQLAMEATQMYESVRDKTCRFIGAAQQEEIIFTKGTTESVNLLAQSFVRDRLKPGDNIVISAMEHHSNLVPWQVLCRHNQAELRIIPMDERGELRLEALSRLIDNRTRLVAIVHVSNALGTINPVEEIIEYAHQLNVPVFLDAAQSLSHQPIDVKALDCDFLAGSGHKLFGPTGVGFLYGKMQYLEEMTPYQFGGEMIRDVSFEETIYHDIPHRFEAGTPNIAGVAGLGAAIDFLSEIGMNNIRSYTRDLGQYALDTLRKVDGIRIIGEAKNRTSIISFLLNHIHPHDIGTVLNEAGIAIRAGHHCTQPVMDFFEIPGTARVSFTIYNTKEDVERTAKALESAKALFQ